MLPLSFHVIKSPAEQLAHASAWDDLWQRSGVTSPLAQLELVQNWCRAFDERNSLELLVVKSHDRLIAGIPLITTKLAGFVSVGELPRNEWSGAGDVLIDERDPRCDEAVTLLAQLLNCQPWSIYRFRHVRTGSTAWQRLFAAVQDMGMQLEIRPSHAVSIIPIVGDWDAHRTSWSKNHRHNMKRMLKRLAERGRLEIHRHRPRSPEDTDRQLTICLKLEEQSWKAHEGTCINDVPQIRQYVRDMAQSLAQRGQLEFAFLHVDDQPIAFEFQWNAKGVLHAYKVGYSDEFADCSPGTVLVHELLSDLFRSDDVLEYDEIGPTGVGQKFRGLTYDVGQVTVAPRRLLGRVIMAGYRFLRRAQPPTIESPRTDHVPSENAATDNTPAIVGEGGSSWQ